MISKEDLDKVLHLNRNIEGVIWDQVKPGEFSRGVYFMVRGMAYKIEWWSNVGYLFKERLQIPFDHVELSGTWPNSFKENLQFHYNGRVCAILPVEPYDDLEMMK